MAAVLRLTLRISKLITKPKPEKFTLRAISEANRAAIPSESSPILPMSNYKETEIGFDVKIVLDFYFLQC